MKPIKRVQPTPLDFTRATWVLSELQRILPHAIGAPRTAERIRLAISSAKGAVRHARHRANWADFDNMREEE